MGKGKLKRKCCDSRPRCDRCPILALREGRLPAGWAVHKRKLVKADTLAGLKAKKKKD